GNLVRGRVPAACALIAKAPEGWRNPRRFTNVRVRMCASFWTVRCLLPLFFWHVGESDAESLKQRSVEAIKSVGRQNMADGTQTFQSVRPAELDSAASKRQADKMSA